MYNFIYALIAVACFILGGISTYFAAMSFKKKRWWTFAYDIFTVLLNLAVMSISLFAIFD